MCNFSTIYSFFAQLCGTHPAKRLFSRGILHTPPLSGLDHKTPQVPQNCKNKTVGARLSRRQKQVGGGAIKPQNRRQKQGAILQNITSQAWPKKRAKQNYWHDSRAKGQKGWVARKFGAKEPFLWVETSKKRGFEGWKIVKSYQIMVKTSRPRGVYLFLLK